MTEHIDPPAVDQALLRGMTERRFGRRDLFRYAGTGAGALGLGAILSACAIPGTGSQAPKSTQNPNQIFAGEPAGVLNFANWPYYIDSANHSHPSLVKFTDETGITVNYKPVIQGNPSFFATIEPALQAGQDTGWDLMVITNGTTLDKLTKLNYLTPLDLSKMTNFSSNASPSVRNPSYDPGNKYTVAWQSGFTGIGYNPKLTGREITSINDLNDPKFKGKIGMFGDNADLPNFGLLITGADPETSTPDQWQKAADWLNAQKPLVRQYYEQNYITALENGDIWITMGWSGDIFIANLEGYTDLKFVIPDEGGNLWTDNMCIPLNAAHPVDAITYMDYVYKVDVASLIADWVNYITPVPGAKSVPPVSEDPTVADSPLVFPDADTLAKGHRYYVFKTPEEEDQWNNLFQPIYQG